MTAIVLVGLMGSGKSAVGAAVARRTGREFVDVDVVIRQRTGKTVRDLWQAGGEPAYRDLESQVVLETLERGAEVVLAAPGGVVLDPAVRQAFAGAFVAYLRARPSTLSERVRNDDHRPLLGDHPLDVLTAMAGERARRYEQLADVIIDTDDESVETVASRVVDALHELRSST
jgi:shikimate kinase